MWKNLVEPDSPRMTIQNGARALHAGQGKRQAHWDNVIRIAFPRSQWLRERALITPYTFIACFVELLFRQKQGVPLYVRWIEQIDFAKDILQGRQFNVLACK